MTSLDRRSRARRGLAVYFAVLVPLSAACQAAMILDGSPITEQIALVLALMWSPTIAMIAARAILREGISDVSFRLGRGWREYALAWLYPVLVGALAYGIGWASGVAFAVPAGIRMLAGDHPALAMLTSLAISLTIGTVASAVTATGEELGWRGYMLTRLIDAGVPRPVLVGGAIWALWHTPLIVSGQYAAGPHPALSAAGFFVSIAASSYVYARVRLATGSVWPAVLLHSSWNAVIQGTFDAFVPGHDAARATNVWVGESGVLVVAADALLAIALTWAVFAVRRAPSDPEPATGSVRTL